MMVVVLGPAYSYLSLHPSSMTPCRELFVDSELSLYDAVRNLWQIIPAWGFHDSCQTVRNGGVSREERVIPYLSGLQVPSGLLASGVVGTVHACHGA